MKMKRMLKIKKLEAKGRNACREKKILKI